MLKFIGEYAAKVDDKGRVVLPSAFKSALAEQSPEDLRLVVKKDIFAPCLEMYAYSEWVKESELVTSKLNPFNVEHAMFRRKYMSGRAVVEPDGKIGRLSIPRKLLDEIGVTKEVVFSGNDYKIEIWAKERYETALLSDEEYVAIAEKLSDLG